MQFVLAIQERNRIRARQRADTMQLNRQIRDLSNPFNIPNFSRVYRFSVETAIRIIDDVKPYYPRTSYACAIPVELKFLAALHFFAQGSLQKSCGRDAGCIQSQPSMSRAITQTVQFPIDRSAKAETIEKNHRRFGIPGVVGYVDGTHVNITKPTEHEELFVNRKGVHSLNVQMVCDCDLRILNVFARYPGSSHDSYIWKSSGVRADMITAYNEDPC